MPKRTIQPDDLFQMRFLQGAALSPDGTQVVYVVSHTEQENQAQQQAKPSWREYRTLWLLSLQDGRRRQLTAGTQNDHSPSWSPDGKTIAFVSNRQEKPQIYLLPVDGDEASRLTQMKGGVSGGPVWSPDGKEIAFTASSQDEAPDPNQPYRITRDIYRFDGWGYLDRAQQEIYSIQASSGELTRWTNDNLINTAPVWSPDGQQILYVAWFGPQMLLAMPQLCTVNRVGTVRVLLTDWRWVFGAQWTPDGQHVLFHGSPGHLPFGTQNDLWRMPVQGGEPSCLTSEITGDTFAKIEYDMPASFPRRILVDQTHSVVYIPVQHGGEGRIYRVSLDGTHPPQAVVAGERFTLPLDLKAGNLLFAGTTLFQPFDLFLLNTATGAEAQLTHLNEPLLAERLLPSVHHLAFTGEDGTEVEGWILLPAQGEAPFPGYLAIHGGPDVATGYCFNFDFHMLAGAGYAVVFINYRGSVAYGDAFATATIGARGHLDYTDLMAGVDYAIAQGYLDPDRLAVGGLSNGGNLTCWIIGQTDRFKAAIPANPMTNWLSFYGTSDVGPAFALDSLGGHPHEIPEVYRRCSPITYAHRCTTPTLLIQSEQDWRCPAEQAEQFYTVLKVNGCTVEMLRLPHASHASFIDGPPHLRQAQNEALLDWLKRYVPTKQENVVTPSKQETL